MVRAIGRRLGRGKSSSRSRGRDALAFEKHGDGAFSGFSYNKRYRGKGTDRMLGA